MTQSTFLLEEPPARVSASPASGADWETTVVTCRLNSLDWLTASGPAGWSGRMSPASYPLSATPRPIQVRRRHQWTWDATAQKWKLKTSTAQKKYTHQQLPGRIFRNRVSVRLSDY